MPLLGTNGLGLWQTKFEGSSFEVVLRREKKKKTIETDEPFEATGHPGGDRFHPPKRWCGHSRRGALLLFCWGLEAFDAMVGGTMIYLAFTSPFLT